MAACRRKHVEDNFDEETLVVLFQCTDIEEVKVILSRDFPTESYTKDQIRHLSSLTRKKWDSEDFCSNWRLLIDHFELDRMSKLPWLQRVDGETPVKRYHLMQLKVTNNNID